MSGGSWNYISEPMGEAAEKLLRSNGSEAELRRAAGRLMKKLAEAMHEIEWVDSCDNSPGDEREALLAVFSEPGKHVEARELLEQIDELRTKVTALCTTD